MSFDASEYTKTAEKAPQEPHQGGGWLAENVWNPMVNGSGAIQIYNNFVDHDVALRPQAPASLGSPEWAIQTLAGAAGAIVPYVIAGKVTGKLFGAAAESIGLRGTGARIASSTAVANVLGAGAYDALKKPLEGETRLGNSIGTMAGFTVFEGGNHLLGRNLQKYAGSLNTAERLTAQTVGRVGVGALGGLTSYETVHTVSGLLGKKDERNWEGRFESMVSGGFLNVALPAVHNGVTRAVDYGYNARSYGPGVPVERFLSYNGVNDPGVIQNARWNPQARVKVAVDGITKADVNANVIHVPEDAAPGKIAHELRHLRVARELEPHYQAVAEVAKVDPSRAENQFYNMRAYAEFQARLMEGLTNSSTSADGVTKIVENAGMIGEQKASNGRTYQENWTQEWQQLQNDPKFRPRFEYDGNSEPVKDKNIVVTDGAGMGAPEPLGATVSDKGINFSVRSEVASKVELLLFDNNARATDPVQSLPMNRTGDVWHRFVDGAPSGTTYLYRAFGPYNPAIDGTRFNGNMGLLDPYSKAITGDSSRPLAYDNSNPTDPNRHLLPGEVDGVKDMSKSVAVKSDFDWKGDKPPETPMTDSLIYELNVKGFTGGVEELGRLRGTYRGLVEKIPHLKKLGVTAVELMPVFQFEKIDSFNGQMAEQPVNPENGKPLRNQWGYQTIGYQAPEASYAADGVRGQQVDEFKYMVRELHKNNIEVILDVVFNHTAEDGELGPTISFRGLDNKVYYMLAPNAPEKYLDHTGCRNTLNVNEPAVRQLIMDTLRYWTKEMHVDGFRFDLATVFNYDIDNIDKPKTPIITEIENDPVLSRVKLIAEPWSIDQYKIGKFSETRWAEWNGVFRDTVRQFLKSDSGQLKDLAERITGSRTWFEAAKDRFSINFVTAHDGFTLNDLVSYNEKHNFGNGEGNRDGSGDNHSWNHGVEGPVEKANIPESQRVAIEQLRNRQVKNAFAMLFLSQGTPMMLAGDEFRRTTDGNNNYWPQEDLNIIDWNLAQKHADVLNFTAEMSALRKRFQIGRATPADVTWHGTNPFEQNFEKDGRFIAWQLAPREGQPRSLYSAFNAYWEPLTVKLPPGEWRMLADTHAPAGQDIIPPEKAKIFGSREFLIQPRTGVIFESALPTDPK